MSACFSLYACLSDSPAAVSVCLCGNYLVIYPLFRDIDTDPYYESRFTRGGLGPLLGSETKDLKTPMNHAAIV